MKDAGLSRRGSCACKLLALAFLLALSPIQTWAFPASIQIHGILVDASDNPLTGQRNCQVRYFDKVTSGTQLGDTQNTIAKPNAKGEFDIAVLFPYASAQSDRVWYELAIDSAPKPGGTLKTVSPRIELRSVPFALFAKSLVGKIGARQVADGSITDTEFLRLNGIKSNIQGQLDAKANLLDVYSRIQINTMQAAQDAAIAAKANISDVYTKAQVEALQTAQNATIATKAVKNDVYTKAQVDASQAAQDTAIAAKANSGDVYTKALVDSSQKAQDDILAAHALRLAGDDLLLTTHAMLLASYADILTSVGQQLKFDRAVLAIHAIRFANQNALLSTHTLKLAEHDALLADHAGHLTQIDASQAAQDALIASHGLRLDLDDLWLTSHTQMLAANAVTLTSFTQQMAIGWDWLNYFNEWLTYDDTLLSSHTQQLALKMDAANAYTKSQIDAREADQDEEIAAKADSTDIYSKTAADARFLRTEADTLATVTARGATTAQNLTLSGNTQSITHTGATGLTLNSAAGYLRFGQGGNTNIMNLMAGRADINTTAAIANSLNVNNGLLTADAVNSRVGVGTAAPAAKFHVANQIGSGANIMIGGTVTAATQMGIYGPTNVLDGNVNTQWYSLNYWDTGGNVDQWVKYDFGSPTVVTGYYVRIIRMAPNWKFQGSNDDSTWADLDTHTGFSCGVYDQFTFTIPNRAAFRYYRVFVSQADFVAWSNYIGLTDMALYCNYSTDVMVAGTAAMPAGVGINNPVPVSILDVGGSLGLPIRSTSVNTTLTDLDYTVIVKAAATVTLPEAASVPGRIYVIKRYPGIGGPVTLAPQPGEKLEGAASSMGLPPNASFTVQSDGIEWYVINSLPIFS